MCNEERKEGQMIEERKEERAVDCNDESTVGYFDLWKCEELRQKYCEEVGPGGDCYMCYEYC